MKLLASLTKWASIPVFLIASMFAQFAGEYQSVAEIVCCVGAVALGAWALRNGDYLWAGGLGMVAIVFSPLSLVNKVFTLMVYMAIGTLLSIWAALRLSRGAQREEDDDLMFQPLTQPIAQEEEACHLESISSGF